MAGEAILVVDDNELNVKLLRYILEKRGYTVRTASNAAEARTSMRAQPPRLVLMDVQMPDVDGLTLTREFKADPALRDIPVIAVTSHAMTGDEERCRAAGCDGYITKPIDPRQLPLQIDAVLKRS